MFYSLLYISAFASVVIAISVAWLFHGSVKTVFKIATTDQMAQAIAWYVAFATLVVGLGSSTNSYALRRYLEPELREQSPLPLTNEAWVFELWTTVNSVLQNLAWLYVWAFHLAIVAFVVLRAFNRIGCDPAK